MILRHEEAAALKEAAAREGLTVSEWVRRSTRDAARRQTAGSAGERMAAIHTAAEFAFPTADIDTMLDEIKHSRGR